MDEENKVINFEEALSQNDREKVKEATNALDGVLKELQNEENEDLMRTIGALLNLPDEQFVLVAPGVLESFKLSVNNPNDKLALTQAINASGYRAEDLIGAFSEFSDAVNELNLSQEKKDFFKEVIAILINAVNETEGIAKRTINIPIELCHPEAKIPQYAHVSDSGMDLFALEDITIAPGETVLVPTGIKVALPPGYEFQVRPKSGRALKTKLRVANTPGTIDQGYRDEVKVIIENVEPPIKNITAQMNYEMQKLDITSIEYGSSYFIGKGEKFAQLVLIEVPKAAFYRVDNVGEIGEDRGGGFGSTGLV